MRQQPATRNGGSLQRGDPADKARRARDNRAYVRGLLSERQPEFACALAAAVRDLSCEGTGPAKQLTCPFCGEGAVAARGTALTFA